MRVLYPWQRDLFTGFRKCPKCSEWKPLRFYGKAREMKNGLTKRCLACTRASGEDSPVGEASANHPTLAFSEDEVLAALANRKPGICFLCDAPLVKGCGGRGMCMPCYNKVIRSGLLDSVPKLRKANPERLAAKQAARERSKWHVLKSSLR
jgi:ferredoxin